MGGRKNAADPPGGPDWEHNPYLKAEEECASLKGKVETIDEEQIMRMTSTARNSNSRRETKPKKKKNTTPNPQQTPGKRWCSGAMEIASERGQEKKKKIPASKKYEETCERNSSSEETHDTLKKGGKTAHVGSPRVGNMWENHPRVQQREGKLLFSEGNE